jgi:hypothetical protein
MNSELEREATIDVSCRRRTEIIQHIREADSLNEAMKRVAGMERNGWMKVYPNTRAALSTEAQPEVTGAVARIGVDSCGGEPVVEIYCNFPDGIHDLYLSSAIEAAVREKLEEVLQMCIAKKEHAEKTYGVSEAVGADMCIRGVRALMESPHTSVEEPANQS